jgi:endonuclease G
MKRLLTIVFLLFTLISVAQNRIVETRNAVFWVKYSEELEQPLQVKYTIACTETVFSRAGLDFFPVSGIKTSDHNDYAGNEWDKGHMAPAADFACNQEYLKMTFSYLNCALQQENLNRGVWRFLEVHERELAKTGEVKVIIDLHFSAKSIKLASGATVPDGFTKTIIAGKKTEKYYFPNTKPTKKSYTEYSVVNK